MGQGDLTTPLANDEIELVRQWILRGAPQTGNVVDFSMLTDYYTNGGVGLLDQPPVQAAIEGFKFTLCQFYGARP